MTTTVPDRATSVDVDVDVDARVEQLTGRLIESTVGAIELFTVSIGQQLGLYEAIDELAPVTADEVAAKLSLDQRYVQEWCEQQAIAGLLTAAGEPRAFALAPGVRPVLLEPVHPAYLAPVAWLQECIVPVIPQLVDGFRTGAGVAYAEYGPRAVEGQAALNRPAFVNFLASEWVPSIDGLHDRLSDRVAPATVADVGCGAGYAAIALASAYPSITVRGYDADEASIAIARRNAAEAGVADRVHFEVVDRGTQHGDRFDVAFLFECLHDMAYPTEVLRNLRAALTDEGYVVVVDERADDEFGAPGDLIQRFLASCSVVWCLPQSRTAADSEALGTLLRPATMSRIATDAGYSAVEDLGIEHPLWRFYKLTP